MKLSLFKKNKNHPSLPTAEGVALHKIGRDNYVDWAVMFSIAVVVVMCLVGWGLYVYFNIESRLSNASNLNTAKKPETVNEKVLGDIIEEYTIRAAERAILLKGYGGFGDPSI